MRALDLFCGAGGASAGLAAAGFDVTGVDIEPQPEYPFRFIQADALVFPLDGYDFIWASPPCQAFTAYKRRPNHVEPAPNLIETMRHRLWTLSCPWVIENVVGAPLRSPILLCGSMFGLEVRRHRCFELNRFIQVPDCNHRRRPQYPQATNRKNQRSTVEVGVWRIPLETQRKAMGIQWMSRERLSQAVPPAYAEWLARRINGTTNQTIAR